MRAVFCQPHQDDAVIALGGCVQKMLARGWEIIYVYITDGRHGSAVVPPEELVAIRREEARREREAFGVTAYHEMNEQDASLGRLDGEKRANLVERLGAILQHARPDVLILPSSAEMHADHVATHDLALEARTAAGVDPLVMKYFVWLFPDFYRKRADMADRILMVGIDGEIEAKLAAIRLHQSQVSGLAYDQMAETVDSYFAHAFQARQKIGARWVEIVGLYGAGQAANELMETLQPCADITEVLHGRPSTG